MNTEKLISELHHLKLRSSAQATVITEAAQALQDQQKTIQRQRKQLADLQTKNKAIRSLIIKSARPARDGAWPCCVHVEFNLLAQWNTETGGVAPPHPLTVEQALDEFLKNPKDQS